MFYQCPQRFSLKRVWRVSITNTIISCSLDVIIINNNNNDNSNNNNNIQMFRQGNHTKVFWSNVKLSLRTAIELLSKTIVP